MRFLRALFVLVYVVIYAITLSAVALEQTVGTINGRDPHPWMYFRRVLRGALLLYSTAVYT